MTPVLTKAGAEFVTPLSVAALAALGAADMISVYVRQTLVQIVTPDHMRGRVASMRSVVCRAIARLAPTLQR